MLFLKSVHYEAPHIAVFFVRPVLVT